MKLTAFAWSLLLLLYSSSALMIYYIIHFEKRKNMCEFFFIFCLCCYSFYFFAEMCDGHIAHATCCCRCRGIRINNATWKYSCVCVCVYKRLLKCALNVLFSENDEILNENVESSFMLRCAKKKTLNNNNKNFNVLAKLKSLRAALCLWHL